MKIFTNKCPLCEEWTNAKAMPNARQYPQHLSCKSCGGTFLHIGDGGQFRAMTIKEFAELRKKFPTPPPKVKKDHDELCRRYFG